VPTRTKLISAGKDPTSGAKQRCAAPGTPKPAGSAARVSLLTANSGWALHALACVEERVQYVVRVHLVQSLTADVHAHSAAALEHVRRQNTLHHGAACASGPSRRERPAHAGLAQRRRTFVFERLARQATQRGPHRPSGCVLLRQKRRAVHDAWRRVRHGGQCAAQDSTTARRESAHALTAKDRTLGLKRGSTGQKGNEGRAHWALGPSVAAQRSASALGPYPGP
jgi:hypothetical protein